MKFAKPMLAIALVSSLSFVNANAIGDREKGALVGAGAMLLLPTMVQNMGVLFGGNQVIHSEPVKYHNSRPVAIEREKVIIIEESRHNRDRYHRYDRHRHDRFDRSNRHHKDRYDSGQQIIIIQR
jgi:hypothetical protein